MQQLIKEYWPFVLLILWWTYKWWRAKQVKSELPVLKSAGATLVDVRSVGEFANANAAGTVNIPLSELSSRLNEYPKTSQWWCAVPAAPAAAWLNFCCSKTDTAKFTT